MLGGHKYFLVMFPIKLYLRGSGNLTFLKLKKLYYGKNVIFLLLYHLM